MFIKHEDLRLKMEELFKRNGLGNKFQILWADELVTQRGTVNYMIEYDGEGSEFLLPIHAFETMKESEILKKAKKTINEMVTVIETV